jgi:protein-disulfide isomerase
MEKQNLFDIIPSKTAFWLGIGSAILGIGTLGFILLATCMFRGSCSISDLSLKGDSGKGIAVNADPSGEEPAPTGAVPAVTDEDHIKGNKNAPVTLIEYSDFECPYCGAFEPTMDTVLAKYKDQVRLVYRHFPLSFHANAQPAAIASECAAEQGKFWEFHAAMFKNQDALSADFYKKLATDNKLNLTKFNDCVSTQKYLTKIQDQASAGGAAGINGTPGTFVIGKDGTATPITGAVPAETFFTAIDKALGK